MAKKWSFKVGTKRIVRDGGYAKDLFSKFFNLV